MQWPSIKRGSPDVGFMICRNTTAALLTDGEMTEWDTTVVAGRLHGVDVILGTLDSLKPAGMVSGNIVVGDFGRVQCFGFHPNAKTDAAALAAGTILKCDAAGEVIAGAVGDDPNARIGVCLRLGAGNRAGIMLRVM